MARKPLRYKVLNATGPAMSIVGIGKGCMAMTCGTRAPSDSYTLQITQLALLVERLGDRTDDLDVRATLNFPKYSRRNMQ